MGALTMTAGDSPGHLWTVLASAVVLCGLQFFAGSEQFFHRAVLPRVRRRPAEPRKAQALGIYYRRLCAVFLYGAAPGVVIAFMLDGHPEQYGLAPAMHMNPLVLALMAVLACATLMYFSRRSTLYRRYPEVRLAATSASQFALSSVSYLLYFFAYEFMFRGFLLFGMVRHAGTWGAAVLSTFFSALVHLRTPVSVILGSMATGLLFAKVALWAGSLWPIFILHSGIGIGMDLLCSRAYSRSLLPKIR
jgi:membrane protease YdiL (CAAX protease family)